MGDYRPSHVGLCVRDLDLLFLADPDGVRVELMAVPSGTSPA